RLGIAGVTTVALAVSIRLEGREWTHRRDSEHTNSSWNTRHDRIPSPLDCPDHPGRQLGRKHERPRDRQRACRPEGAGEDRVQGDPPGDDRSEEGRAGEEVKGARGEAAPGASRVEGAPRPGRADGTRPGRPAARRSEVPDGSPGTPADEQRDDAERG